MAIYVKYKNFFSYLHTSVKASLKSVAKLCSMEYHQASISNLCYAVAAFPRSFVSKALPKSFCLSRAQSCSFFYGQKATLTLTHQRIKDCYQNFSSAAKVEFKFAFK